MTKYIFLIAMFLLGVLYGAWRTYQEFHPEPDPLDCIEKEHCPWLDDPIKGAIRT